MGLWIQVKRTTMGHDDLVIIGRVTGALVIGRADRV